MSKVLYDGTLAVVGMQPFTRAWARSIKFRILGFGYELIFSEASEAVEVEDLDDSDLELG